MRGGSLNATNPISSSAAACPKTRRTMVLDALEVRVLCPELRLELIPCH